MKITINGKDIEIDDSKELIIEFTGNLEKLSCAKLNNSIAQNITISGGINFGLQQVGNISINPNRVVINEGVYTEKGDITGNNALNKFLITVNGNVGSIDTLSGDVEVKGGSQKIKTVSGDVTVHNNVNGNIQTISGDVNIKGSVSGSINTISGDITTVK